MDSKLIIGVSALILSASVNAAQPLFEDVTAQAGVSGSNVNQGFSGGDNALTSHGSGIAWLDFNNDDWPDLYIVNKSGANRLYENNRDGTFKLVNLDEGMSPIAGDDSALLNRVSRGVTVGDYDNDGWDDIFVSNEGINSLLRNNSDGKFVEVPGAISGIIDEADSIENASSFGDVDNDGDLDLFISHWVNVGIPFDPDLSAVLVGQSDFYRNNLVETGNATFVRIDNGLELAAGGNHTSLFSDYDGDGDLDAIIPTDFGAFFSATNEREGTVLENNGGIYSVNSQANMVVRSIHDGMGIAAGDYDRDGDLDYYITNSVSVSVIDTNTNELIQNDSTGNFSPVAQITGTTGAENLLEGGPFWGAVFADLDNDGLLDLYTGVDNRYFAGPDDPDRISLSFNRLYKNNGPDNQGLYAFDEVSSSAGVDVVPGMGIATADYNRDGKMDMVAHGRLGDVILFKNTTVSDNDWLQIRLKGSDSNIRGVGAKVRLTSTSPAGQIEQMQEIHAGSSHGSTNAFPVHFGIPVGSTIDQLRVEWPSGQTQVATEVPLNHSVQVTEGVAELGLEPAITSVTNGSGSPASYIVGDAVIIIGSNLCGNPCDVSTTRVSINGVEATPLAGSSDNLLVFIIPVGASTGPLVVTTNSGSSVPQEIVIDIPPVITSMSAPNGFVVGQGVVIEGNYLCGVPCDHATTKVNVNGIEVSPFGIADTWLIFFIPEGAESGQLTVTTASGVSEPQDFTLDTPPVITSMSAPNGFVVGQGVVIEGNYLCGVPCDHATTKVNVNGIEVSPFGIADTWLIFFIPEGAESGQLTVTTASGVSEPQDFTLDTPPVITSMSAPNGFVVGQGVVIEGNYLCGVPCDHATTKVNVNGIEVSPFGIADTWLIFFIPEGAESGQLTVNTASGVSQPQTFTLE